MERDIPLISPQYYSQYHAQVFHHYQTLPSSVFWWNLFYLTGAYGDIVNMRQRIVNGDKFDKSEKPFMRKCITPEIQEWLDAKHEQSQAQHVEDVKDSIYANIREKMNKKGK